MNKNTQTVLGVVLILVIVGVIAWMATSQHFSNKYPNGASALDSTSLSAGNSDSDLQSDLAKVDAQMKGLYQGNR